MNTSVVSTRSIELILSQTDLYPPLLGTAPAIMGFSTGLPAGEDIAFTLVVNGVPGVPVGIEVRTSTSVGGILLVDREFISHHAGAWPVQVTLQASRNGIIIDHATLWLHDTRHMRVHHMVAELLPNPAHVSDVRTVIVIARTTFYDRAGLSLPPDEVPWSITLPGGQPGLEVEGAYIHIAPGTASGDVSVHINEPSGVGQTLTLTLLPALDIGLELSRYDLYPPLRDPNDAMVIISTALPPELSPVYTYRLNGQAGQRPGIFLQVVTGAWTLRFYREFLMYYHGPWPAEITVRATLDGQLAGQRTLYLHDTGNMVVSRMEMQLHPSDTVAIPSEGLTVVHATPRFHDPQDVPLPLLEIDWDAALEGEPVPGVERTGHVLLVRPDAQPGQHRLTVIGPNDLSVSRILTLQ